MQRYRDKERKRETKVRITSNKILFFQVLTIGKKYLLKKRLKVNINASLALFAEVQNQVNDCAFRCCKTENYVGRSQLGTVS